MSATERDHEAALEVLELCRKLDVPIEDMTAARFREHGGSVSNGRWGLVKRLAAGEDTRQGSIPRGQTLNGQSEYIRTETGGVWIKSGPEDRKLAAFERMVEAVKDLTPLAPTKAPDLPADAAGYLNAFVCGGMHMGLYCSARVSEEQWGRADALAMGQAAIDYLVDRMDPAEQAVFVDTGDWLHAASAASTTVKGTHVDTDGLFVEALVDGYRLKEYMIRSILRRHDFVHVRSSKGNHGGSSELGIDLAIAARFYDDPRVCLGVSREQMIDSRYLSMLEFGKVLLVFAHGDHAKVQELLGMVSDRYPEVWGRTRYRWAVGGHLHHYATGPVHGGEWETYPVLAPADAWHSAHRWSSKREMHAVRYHRDQGRTDRVQVSAAQLRAIMDAHQPVAEAA